MSDTLETMTSYDRIAEEYAVRIADELNHKPFDRIMLDWLVERAGRGMAICDLGCGPGHMTRYLSERGVLASGIDLSPGMIAVARRLHPGIVFTQGDMCALTDVADGTFTAVAVPYSIIHVPRAAIPTALGEVHRILRPGGLLYLTFHLGEEDRHLDVLWDHPVNLDFEFFGREEMQAYLRAAAFSLDETIERDPYPDVEVQTRRCTIFAHRGP